LSLRKKKGEGPLHPQPEGWGIRDPPHSLCNKYYVIDGQQRLMTIYYFKKQRFPKKEMRAKLRRIFNEEGKIPDNVLNDDMYFSDFKLDLSGPIEENRSKLHNLKYSMLGDYKTSFDLRTIRNIFIKQNSPPKDDSSLFELFNRLNTGGVNLNPQEIRASVYPSKFYDMLNRANLDFRWRKLIGLEEPDMHMKDIEIMLRGFSMLIDREKYKGSMARFLNSYSKKAQGYSEDEVSYLENLFKAFLDKCSILGHNPFTLKTKKFNISMYESVFVALCDTGYRKHNLEVKNIDLSQLRFGNEFKCNCEKKVKEDPKLEEAVGAFIELGIERNKLIHTNLAASTIEKTLEEYYDLYKKSIIFLEFMNNELNKK